LRLHIDLLIQHSLKHRITCGYMQRSLTLFYRGLKVNQVIQIGDLRWTAL
jgi:hypothetical protein